MSIRGHHGLMLPPTGSGPSVFPVVLSVTTSSFAAATNHNVAMPATVSNGDLLIAYISSDGTGSASAITTPSGWTLLDSQQGAISIRGSFFYRVADGTEGGTTVNFVTGASEELSTSVLRIQVGTHAGELASDLITFTTVNAPVPPVTAPWGSAKNLWIAGLTPNTNTEPSTYPLPNNHSHVPRTGASSVICTDAVETDTLSPVDWGLNTSGVTGLAVVRPA